MAVKAAAGAAAAAAADARAAEAEDRMHEGHRQRLTNRFLCEGLEGFEEHEILELLLFYALPRVDTNTMAHELIRTFGSLAAVLEADPKDVERVGGIGPKASAFLAMIPDVFRAYERSKLGRKPALRSIANACGFARTLLFGKPYEQFYVIWLGTQNRVIHVERMSEGSANESPVYISRIASKALRHHAVKCVIAHNHPGGSVMPSKADIETTQSVLSALALLGIELVDHIIVSENEAFSFQADSLMGKCELAGREAYAAEYVSMQQLSEALKTK